MSQLFDDEQIPVIEIGDVWQRCLADLQFAMKEQDFNQWIHPLSIKLSSKVLTLTAPNALWVQHIKDHYLADIKSSVFKHAQGLVVEVIVETVNLSAKTAIKAAKKTTLGKLLAQSEQLNESFTFERFVKGKSNSLAYNACHELSKKDYNNSYGPVFLYGSSGLGKTHLMHAIAHRYRKHGKSFCYFTKEHFFEKTTEAFRENKMDDFVKQICQADLLIVDDVHLFDGKSAPKVTQILTTLFDTFSKTTKKQVVMASDRHPTQMKGFDDRFLSRFSGGLSLMIEPPDMEMRVQILDKKASLMGFELPKECALFMAQNLPSDVRGLEGALKQVDMIAKIRGEPVSLALVSTAIKDKIAARARALNAENIRDVVAEYYGVSSKDLMSKKRMRTIARPRQMAMALIRELTKDSFPEIGQAFGGRDHTTVMHACEKIEELKLTDPSIEKDYNSLKMMLEFS